VLLHVHEWGDPSAPPVVCLHGVTGHGRRLRGLAERLEERRVLAFDLRGHGRSGWLPPWDTETHVEDVLETAAASGVERADWVGASFGGRLAAEIANRIPVGRLCLLDPALSLPADSCLERAELMRADGGFADPEEAIQEQLESGALYSTPREILEEEMREHLMRRDDGRLEYRYLRSAVVAAFGEMARPAPAVASVPTLIVLGEHSWIEQDLDRYRRALDGDVRVVTIASGHSLWWDALDDTATAVVDFLSEG
jgi:lipase